MPNPAKIYPAKTWRDAFNAFNPTVSLTADDPRYVDLSPGRGNQSGLVRRALRKIESSEEPISILVAGHIGSGKTTELQQLRRTLESSDFWVADLSLEQDLDIQDPVITDILLALARQLVALFEEKHLGLDNQLLDRIESWFHEVIRENERSRSLDLGLETEAKAGGGFSFLSFLATLTSQIRTGTTSKTSIREKFEPRIAQLHQSVRDLIQDARAKVKALRKRDLVLIVDALDRIPYRRRAQDELSLQETIFIESGDLLRDLGCHLVLTVPISLVYSDRHKHLESIFPDRFVVPMTKITERGGAKAEGWDLLRQLLHKRLDPAWLPPEVADELIRASGGHPRQLVTLVRAALDFVDDTEPLTPLAIKKAVHQLADGFGRSIPTEDWPRLAEVHRSKMAANDAAHQAMLFNLCILEYQNDERWCDVNPLILGLPQFRDAWQARTDAGNPTKTRPSRR